jgi:hypothetical protein
MESKLVSTFADLVALLESENVPCQGDAATQVVTFPVKNGPLDSEMIIRWEKQLLLAQFAVAFPYKIPPQHMALTEHALALINHRLIMPAFGVDHDNRLLYYRVVVPRTDDGALSYDHLFRLVSTTIDTMIDFYELLGQVVLQGAAVEPLLDELTPKLKAAVAPSEPSPTEGQLPS